MTVSDLTVAIEFFVLGFAFGGMCGAFYIAMAWKHSREGRLRP